MLIHNLVATGSISYNGVNISYVTGSQTSLDGLNQFSASVNTTTGSLNSTTGSLNTATGSLFTASGSFSTRVTTIESKYATTGSNIFTGAQTVCANITSTGTIIAQTLNVQQVTSSIVYSSGSNIFGCSTGDVQQFTGSVRITGSLNVIGNACITSVCSPAFVGGTVSGTTIYGSTAICGGVVCGTSATFSSSGQFGDILTIARPAMTTQSDYAYQNIKITSGFGSGYTGAKIQSLLAGYDSSIYGVDIGYSYDGGGAGNAGYSLRFSTNDDTTGNPIERLRINSTGAATFSSSVRSNSHIIVSDGSSANVVLQGYINNALRIAVSGSTSSGGSRGDLYAGATDLNSLVVDVNTLVVDATNDRVGIGNASPYAKLEVVGGNNLPPSTGTQNYTVALRDPTSMVADVGGSILLQGFKTSNTAIGNFAYVAGKKENGTAGNEAGYLSLGTFDSSGIPAERMRINSTGVVSISGSTATKIDFITNTARFYGGSLTNTFALGANDTMYYQGDSSQFYPTLDNTRCLGTGTYRYSAVYAANGTIQTSDRNEKTNIATSDLGLDYVTKLKPVSYSWKQDDGKKHYGLIAQDIENLGIEFGGLNTENGRYGLNYSEFISPLIKAIQEQQCKINILESCLGIN